MKIGLTVLTALFVISNQSLAGIIIPAPPPAPAGPTFTGTNDTRAGIGLRYEFGDNALEVVGTVRKTYTDTNNTVTGALGEISFPFITQRKSLPKLRIMGLYGLTGVQGEAGLGYDFANQQPLLGLGVQGPYVEGGVNVLLNQEFHPYLGANTFGNAPDKTTVPAPVVILVN